MTQREFWNFQLFSHALLCRHFRAGAYMKHDSRKPVVAVWAISKGRQFVHLPLSPSIEMSKKHLGLFFSDIFYAK